VAKTTLARELFVSELLASAGYTLPENVADAVLARAARLSPRCRRLLEAIAVAEPQADLCLVDRPGGPATVQLTECIESG
jgi:hypothetical protein